MRRSKRHSQLHFNIVRVVETESTNTEAKILGYSGATTGTVVVAERQTAGRGRQGRNWLSGEGNLLFSILLKPDCSPSEAAELGFVIAVSMRRAILELEPQIGKISFKWPNDILLNGKKVCGILLESDLKANRVENMVAGIGVNVGSYPEGGVDYEATSLNNESGKNMDLKKFLQQFLDFFAADYEAWKKDGFGTYHKLWNTNAEGLGKTISVKTEGGEISGVFRGILDSGSLVLELEKGDLKYINTGDVYFNRHKGEPVTNDNQKRSVH